MDSKGNQIKILVELMHGIGDIVCALPMLKVLRDNYPQAIIVILTKNQAGKDIVLSSHIEINEIHVFNIYINIKDTIRFFRYLRSKHFTYGISSSITPVRKAKYFMKIVGPVQWIGLQTQGLCFDLLNDRYHFIEANLKAIREICTIPIKEKIYPHLYPEERVLQTITEKFGITRENEHKVIGVCIGNADYSLKNKFLRTGKVYTRLWGIENMGKLIKNLAKGNDKIILIGGQAEIPLVDEIFRYANSSAQIIDCVGKTDMKESIALAYLCDCVVGVDTGMQHVAAAVGTKTISVFGPTNPLTHGAYAKNACFVEKNVSCKYCYGTPKYIGCSNRQCLSSISVDSVIHEVNCNSIP